MVLSDASPPGKGSIMGLHRDGFRAIAVVLAFAMTQACIQLSFASPTSPSSVAFPPPQLLARLTTKGNLPISVNGISASSGDTVANEATIETPMNVDASVDLGPLGSLDLEPETRIKIEYNGNCMPGSGSDSGPQDPALQKCSVKVTVYAGCVTAHYKKGSYFQAVTQQQVLIAESEKSRKEAGTVKICAGGTGAPAGAAAAGPGGLSNVAKIAIAALLIGGGGVALLVITGNDPTTTVPTP